MHSLPVSTAIFMHREKNLQDLVSVIIPFLNQPGWLTEAIESVLSQSFTHWQLILFDDGSQFETSEIARSYMTRYPGKIIYADHPGHRNNGVTASRKAAVAISTGTFLAFLDSDDKWMPQKLESQMRIFMSNPAAAMICEASVFWVSWKDRRGNDYVVPVGTTPDKLYSPGELLSVIYPLGTGAPPCPSGIVLRRDAYDRSGGFEQSFMGDYQLYEDQALLTKIYLREFVYISAIANNYYRKRDGSLTSMAGDPEIYQKVRGYFLNWFEEYTRANRMYNPTIETLISKARSEMDVSPG